MNSSFGHSVPIIDGKGQKAGKEFTASLSYENTTALCDMTKAYGNDKLLSLERKVVPVESSVFITDRFSFKGDVSVTERFVSLRKAEVTKGKLIFGSTTFIYPENEVTLKLTEEKHTPHEYDTDDITVYCYDFILKENISEITFEIKSE